MPREMDVVEKLVQSVNNGDVRQTVAIFRRAKRNYPELDINEVIDAVKREFPPRFTVFFERVAALVQYGGRRRV